MELNPTDSTNQELIAALVEDRDIQDMAHELPRVIDLATLDTLSLEEIAFHAGAEARERGVDADDEAVIQAIHLIRSNVDALAA